MLDEMTIKAYESNGFKRWTKGDMDRLYINLTQLGLEVDYYKSGNICSASWCGEKLSNAAGARFLSSKVYVDIKTGELHVVDRTNRTWSYYKTPTIEDKARELIGIVEAFAQEA